MKTFVTKKRIIVVLIGIVVLVGIWLLFFRTKAPVREMVAVERGNLEKIVSVTGKVQALDAVDLSFEKSGRVAAIRAEIGDHVSTGTVLLELDHADFSAQLAEAEAARAAQDAKLQEMKQGTRSEELSIAQAAVASAEQALADATANVVTVQNKATADSNDKYDAALNALVKSINVASGSLYTLTDIQLKYFADNSQDSATIADAKARAVVLLLGVHNAGRATNDVLSAFTGGAKGLATTAQTTHASADIETALSATEQALAGVKTALDVVPVSGKLTSTESTSLQTEKSNVAGEIVTAASKEQAIIVQKATNESALAAAQTSAHVAENALISARAQLALKQAGATVEQIAAQEAAVAQAQANVLSVRAQLAKASLVAPISGIVTKQETKIGEIVSPNVPVVSLISDAGFEIEARIPEADIAAVKKNDPANVTLDAYGSKVIFKTKVIAIDPAETIVEGVATYKTTFAFLEKDERIKSGMTANIDIVTDHKDNVLVIPRHAVMGSGDDATVLGVDVSGATRSIKVKMGLFGTNGNAEIVEGVREGDRIVLSPVQ